VRPLERLEPAEDRLNLVAPAGYAEIGDFEQRTGCAVDVTPAESTDDVVRLLSTGRFDGGLGDGDAMVRLIFGGSIAPVNGRLVPRWQDVYDGLKERPFNSVGGQQFALPVGRAANVLLYRRDKVPGTLPGLAAVLDAPQVASYGGQVVVPDDPVAIAEAALWVARQRKDLEITDPYELDRRQFNAVVDVLRHQKPYIETYWHTDQEVISDFRSGEAIVGMVSQEAAGLLDKEDHPEGPYDFTLPKEGSMGISPAWMVSANLRHPGCMYRWLDHVLDPAVQTVVSETASLAPSNRRTCELAEDESPEKERCELFHADDDGYYEKVLFRTTPARDCGDGRGRVCMDYDAWRKAWADITGG
jgi:putative spermidine/putrescine transport system substrate-binding protein